nr:MAG TPA: hypothetical protein [Caudoviricetes sp.]DAS01076.1 MAG TPA: hypothetical protein [Caudoviricetes sp.]
MLCLFTCYVKIYLNKFDYLRLFAIFLLKTL